MPAEPRPAEVGGCTIQFEGAPLSAIPGETVAAVLIAHGRLQQSCARDGTPRGHFCGMGVCHDCLVTIDGEPSVRACMTPVADGMHVARQPYARPAGDGRDAGSAPARSQASVEVDVLVVGAGPGGLAAALALAEGGASVRLVDERPGPGGQYFKQAYGRATARRADRQAREGASLIDRARRAGVDLEAGAMVFGAERAEDGSLRVAVLGARGLTVVAPRYLVVATGAYERPMLVPGWTLPGAMTTGAAQTLVRSYGVSPGRRVLVAGNGPLNLQVALELAELADEVHLIEAAPAPWRRPLDGLALAAAGPRLAWQGISSILHLRRHGIALEWSHRLTEIRGEARVAGAVIAPVGPDGQCARGRARALEVDAVIMGDGFWPSSELARLLGCRGTPERVERGDDGSTSVRDVFVIGEAGGFGGAQIALAQGELAGRTVLRGLGRQPAGDDAAAMRRLLGARRFQSALWKAFAARDIGLDLATPETVVCRCEAIDRQTIEAAVARHAVSDIATLKRLTRAGMGRCQGRYCGRRLAGFVGQADGQGLAPQMPLRPVPVAPLAAEKPEWHGHRRLLPESQAAASAEPLPLTEIDTLVVGAGIAGLSTAYFLASEGRAVAVVDRSFPNSGASGGNAGSLHAQLLSFDHGDKARAASGAARTLPLQRNSITLWQELQNTLGTDLEMHVTGGLMVAETDADLAFLEAKTRVERDNGIDSRVIGRAELQALEPNVSRRLAGAAYCPQEGKINPLVATQALCHAARRAGALVLSQTPVTGISRDRTGFTVATPRGSIRCARVVNAAGAFAGRVARLLGAEVPVYGAPLQMIVTEAVEPLVSCLLAYAGRHLTMKQARNGNLIIGGGWTAGLDPVNAYPRPLMSSIEGNLWVAKRAVPALATVRVIRSWAAMNIDIDGAPILGEHPSIAGFYNVVTANGYTLGPLLGRLTAELIRTGRTARGLGAFSLSRFDAPFQETRQ